MELIPNVRRLGPASKGVLFLRKAAFILLAIGLLAMSQQQVCLSQPAETQLVFYPSINQTFQRNFEIIPAALSNGPISFIRHDLLDSSKRGVIPATDITIDSPSANAPLANTLFRVSIKGSSRSGTYSGKLDILYPSKESGVTQLAQLDLICVVSVPPALEADSATPLVLNAVRCTRFEAFVACESAKKSARFQLQQTVDSPAEILTVYPSTFRSARGLSFSANSISVSPTGAVTIISRDGKSFDVSIANPLPPAGEYNGNIVANVRDQSALIKVPLKIQIKNGWLLPFVILVAGLLVAMLIPWWNSTGKEMSELLDKTIQTIAYLPRQPRLQAADRERISNHFHDVLRAIDVGLPVEQVRSLYQQAQDDITATINATATLIASLDPLVTQFLNLPDATAFKDRLRKLISELSSGLDRGAFNSLADASAAIQKVTDELSAAALLVPQWTALDASNRSRLLDSWRQAATIDDLQRILTQASGPLRGAVPTALPSAPPQAFLPAQGTTKIDNPMFNARCRILLGKLAVSAFLWIVILWGGMVMIYGASPTFGSDPKDYISLFFWGASFEVVRGQIINLAGLKGALKL